jgi:hypothetical protein
VNQSRSRHGVRKGREVTEELRFIGIPRKKDEAADKDIKGQNIL